MRVVKSDFVKQIIMVIAIAGCLLVSINEVFAAPTMNLSKSTDVKIGDSITVNWSGFTGNVNIKVFNGGGWSSGIDAAINQPSSSSVAGTWNRILATTGWEQRTDYKVRVELRSAPATYVESPYFAVGSLTVTSPNGGENWYQGEIKNVTWSSAAVLSSIGIDLYKNGTNQGRLGTVSNTGSYAITVPSSSTGCDYQIAISTSTGNIWDFSNGYFCISTLVPSPPYLSLPSDGTTIATGSDVQFSWGTSTGAGRYRLKICTNSAMSTCINGGNPFEPSNGQTSYTVPASNFATGTTYYWQVGAIAPGDVGGWGVYGPSPAWTFAVDKPQPPSLSLPTNGSTVATGSDVQFSWGTSTGAGRYRLKICTNSAMSTCINGGNPFEPPNGQTSYTVPELNFATGTTYYWQVGAIAPGDVGGWGVYGPSPAWTFTVDKPAPPELIYPASGVSISSGSDIQFTWGTSTGAARYRIKICTDSALSNCIAGYNPFELPLNQTTITVPASKFSTGVTYFWQVGAIAPNDTGGWGVYGPSPAWTFSFSTSQASLTPLYRAYNSTDRSHYYTINNVDKNGPSGKTGYKFEKVEAFIYNSQLPGTIPLYRFYYSTSKKFYYYTTSKKTASAGYTEGPTIVGYVFPNPGNNMVPMYHLEKVSTTGNDHFYTISEAERNNAVSKYLYKDWGVAMYVSRNASNSPLAGKPVANDGGVDLSSGNFQPYYNHVDFANPPGRGVPFVFARTYNAMNTVETGPLGPGWSHSYNIGIVEDAAQNMAFVKWGDGAVDAYNVSGSTYSAYCEVAGATCGNYNKLSKVNGNYAVTTKDYTTYTFTPVTVDTTTYYNVTSIKDRNGNNTAVTYDANGNIDKVTDGSGRIYQFTYIDITTQPGVDSSAFSDGNRYRLTGVVEQEATLARTILFAYDTSGNLWKSWDAENNQTTYEYWSGTPFLSKVTLPKGNSWSASYSGDKVLSVTADSQTTTYTYNDPTKGTIVSTTGSTGGTAGTPVNSNCVHTGSNLKSCTNASSKTAEIMAWHDNANPTQVKDRNGNVWNYTYNSMGNVLTAISPSPLNEMTKYDYDVATGLNLAKTTDPSNNVTEYFYDSNNNLKESRTTDVVEGVTKTLSTLITYYSSADNPNCNGLVKTVTDPRNNITTYTYDTKGYLASVSDPVATSYFTYDAGGRLLEKTDADGVKTYYTYDKLNRVKTAKNGLNQTSTYYYDANGNLDYVVDPRNIRKQNTYRTDNKDLLDKTENINNSTGTTSLLVQYGYDERNRVKEIKNGRLKSWTYAFNDDDTVNTITTPIVAIKDQFNLYDGNGNLKTLVDRSGRSILFNYDETGRLKTQTIGALGNYSFNYYPNSLMQSVTSPQGRSNSFIYSSRNQVKTYTDPFGNTTNYTYDEAGNLKTISYPGGKYVTYGYDARNQLSSVTDINNKTTYYDYKPSGRLWKIRYPNGTVIEYFYDAYGRMWKLENRKADNSIIAGYTVDTFDELGTPKQITTTGGLQATAAASDSGTMSYDDNNRLTSTTAGATFTNNNFGELLTKTQGGATTTFTWNANDLPGRLIGTASLGKTATYSYDALGNRIEAVRDGVTTRYALDVSGSMSNVLYETDGAGVIKAYNIHGLGLVSRILADGSERYYHYDRIGNAVALTNATGVVTDQYTYDLDPFAFSVAKSGNSNNPFTFVGKYGVMDEGNNLFFMRARYFDADAGRFLNEDPIGFDGGDLNVYAYVGSNPVKWIDPSGMNRVTDEFISLVGKLGWELLKGKSLFYNPKTKLIYAVARDSKGRFIKKGFKTVSVGKSLVGGLIEGWLIDKGVEFFFGKGEDAPFGIGFIPGTGSAKSAGGDLDPNNPAEAKIINGQKGLNK